MDDLHRPGSEADPLVLGEREGVGRVHPCAADPDIDAAAVSPDDGLEKFGHAGDDAIEVIVEVGQPLGQPPRIEEQQRAAADSQPVLPAPLDLLVGDVPVEAPLGRLDLAPDHRHGSRVERLQILDRRVLVEQGHPHVGAQKGAQPRLLVAPGGERLLGIARSQFQRGIERHAERLVGRCGGFLQGLPRTRGEAESAGRLRNPLAQRVRQADPTELPFGGLVPQLHNSPRASSTARL